MVKRKSTGNHGFSDEIWGFPGNFHDFPLNPSIDLLCNVGERKKPGPW